MIEGPTSPGVGPYLYQPVIFSNICGVSMVSSAFLPTGLTPVSIPTDGTDMRTGSDLASPLGNDSCGVEELMLAATGGENVELGLIDGFSKAVSAKNAVPVIPRIINNNGSSTLRANVRNAARNLLGPVFDFFFLFFLDAESGGRW